MTIAQYLPQWLRRVFQKLAPQQDRMLSKKDRQVLPTLPKPPRPTARLLDDASYREYRFYWRL